MKPQDENRSTVGDVASPSMAAELELRLQLAKAIADKRKSQRLLTGECNRLRSVIRERQHTFERELMAMEERALRGVNLTLTVGIFIGGLFFGTIAGGLGYYIGQGL